MSGTHEPPEIGTGKLNYEDLVAMPEDGKRYEILDGELVVSASPLTRHQRISRDLELVLLQHVRKHDLGEVFYAPIDVILDEHTVVVPDLVYVSKQRASIIGERGINGAPDLLVEILSPSTRGRDRGAKAKLYAHLGVDVYWIVDPDARTLDVFERNERWYRAAARFESNAKARIAPFPGLEIDLSQIWA
jgi:Uma2 family endonuclease